MGGCVTDVCMYMCMYTHIYIQVSRCMFVYLCMHACVRMYIHTHIGREGAGQVGRGRRPGRFDGEDPPVDCGSASARQGARCGCERVRARAFDECGMVTCVLLLKNLLLQYLLLSDIRMNVPFTYVL